MKSEPPSLEPASPSSANLLGTALNGRYRIERLLGVGGMGSVYQATDLTAERRVAVKVLHREMTSVPEVVARFEREAIAARRIVHPHVTAAGELGVLADGSYFLALEFVSGERLSVEIAHRPFSPVRALKVARQVGLALGAAHAAGVVHRDLKPDNIMLVEHPGPDDFVKVLDFGIAKLSVEDTKGAPQLTRMGAVFGTPEYMSPEQARGVPVDHRADLYALGIILYEMLAGRPPFQDDDVTAVLQAQLGSAPRPLPSRIPASVRAIVTALLEKSPAERLGSAEELVARIDAALATDPALAEQGPAARVGPTLVDAVDEASPAGGGEQALAPTRFFPFAARPAAGASTPERGGGASTPPAPRQPGARGEPAVGVVAGAPAARADRVGAAEDAGARLAPTLLHVRPNAGAGPTPADRIGRGFAGKLRRPVSIGGLRVPVWLLGAMVAASAATVAVVLGMLAAAGMLGG